MLGAKLAILATAVENAISSKIGERQQ